MTRKHENTTWQRLVEPLPTPMTLVCRAGTCAADRPEVLNRYEKRILMYLQVLLLRNKEASEEADAAKKAKSIYTKHVWGLVCEKLAQQPDYKKIPFRRRLCEWVHLALHSSIKSREIPRDETLWDECVDTLMEDAKKKVGKKGGETRALLITLLANEEELKEHQHRLAADGHTWPTENAFHQAVSRERERLGRILLEKVRMHLGDSTKEQEWEEFERLRLTRFAEKSKSLRAYFSLDGAPLESLDTPG